MRRMPYDRFTKCQRGVLQRTPSTTEKNTATRYSNEDTWMGAVQRRWKTKKMRVARLAPTDRTHEQKNEVGRPCKREGPAEEQERKKQRTPSMSTKKSMEWRRYTTSLDGIVLPSSCCCTTPQLPGRTTMTWSNKNQDQENEVINHRHKNPPAPSLACLAPLVMRQR